MGRGLLPPAEKCAWLQLSRTENVGPVAFRQLLARHGSARAALEALPGLAAAAGRKAPLRLGSAAEAERILADHVRLDARLIAACEPDYPPLLAAIEDAPPLISVRGEAGLLARPAVALVGARNASVNGRRLAEMLARDLGAAGLIVVSGLARGIDAAAHLGALDSGTVAVVGSGIDVVYPAENRDLHAAIAARGAILAELPPGTQPRAHHFPQRNRIIAGLTLGTVVVEAALKSGSLITARLAGEQGREVFAVPGSPLDARCRGTNALLRDGAHLVESAADVIEVVRTLHPIATPPTAQPAPPAGVDPEPPGDPDRVRRAVIEMLDPHPVAVDELVRRCQLSPAVLMTALLELELAGTIQRHPGNRVALCLNVSPQA